MAVGNIVGTNIFNILFVLGISSMVRPIAFIPVLNSELIILFSITTFLLLLIYIGKKNVLTRREGGILLSLYVIYIIFLFIRG